MKCKKHPRYQAIRAPKAKCPECQAIWQNKLTQDKQKWQRIIQLMAKAESLLPSHFDKTLYGGYIKDQRLTDAWDELYNLHGLLLNGTTIPEFDLLMKEAGCLLGVIHELVK
jgi:hypothetical protein